MKKYAKTGVALCGVAVQVLNGLTVPDAEKPYVAAAVAAVTALGVWFVKNEE